MRGTAEAVRQALEEAQRAQGMAEQALQQAAGDIQHSERALSMVRAPSLMTMGPHPHHAVSAMTPNPYATTPQMQTQTGSAEQQLAGAMEQIGLLDWQTDALKVKRANNSLAATRAQEAASTARDRAGEAKQVGDQGAPVWQQGSPEDPADQPCCPAGAGGAASGPVPDSTRAGGAPGAGRAAGGQPGTVVAGEGRRTAAGRPGQAAAAAR